jgi:alginate O-acetyltransferase complex protein AlgI
MAVAWFGIVCFAFQIYFDFSGYSDMAIGLGRCFGFRFPENFDWPYTARSVREFWRRWHMSLSRFFRDYLYIPLGGNRKGARRTGFHLILVFLLCGLWHGASWTFVVWGLLHGCFLVLERTRFGRAMEAAPALVGSVYTLAVVLIAWVFFRADDLAHALAYLGAMAGIAAPETGAYPLVMYANAKVFCLLAVAAASLLPPRFGLEGPLRSLAAAWPTGFGVSRYLALNVLLLLCAMSLAAGTHNPFIYFRF